VGLWWEMDDTVWHRCEFPIWPFLRGSDGKLFLPNNGKLWRRRVNRKWQYRQDAETEEESDAMQW